MPHSHSASGGKKDGFTRMTQEAGSNGTAGITWEEEVGMTRGKSEDGKP